MGKIRVILSGLGNIDVLIEQFMACVRYIEIIGDPILIILDVILSNPVALLNFIFLI